MPRIAENLASGQTRSQDLELESGPEVDSARSSLEDQYHARNHLCTVHVRDDAVVQDEAAARDCEVEINREYECFTSQPTLQSTGTVNSNELLREYLKVIF